jgi:hypothetical protein
MFDIGDKRADICVHVLVASSRLSMGIELQWHAARCGTALPPVLSEN